MSRPSRGFVAAIVGTLAGGVGVGATVGAMTFALMPCDPNGLECLGVVLVAAAIGLAGALVGSVTGCYVALRLRGHERAGRTAGYLAALLPVIFAACFFLAGLFNIGSPLIGIAGAAALARRLAIGNATNTVTNDDEKKGTKSWIYLEV